MSLAWALRVYNLAQLPIYIFCLVSAAEDTVSQLPAHATLSSDGWHVFTMMDSHLSGMRNQNKTTFSISCFWLWFTTARDN